MTTVVTITICKEVGEENKENKDNPSNTFSTSINIINPVLETQRLFQPHSVYAVAIFS
jgi:hypothetical protein